MPLSLSQPPEPMMRGAWWVKSFRDLEGHDWPWKHFTPEEIACQGTGTLLVNPRFMDKLQAIRDELGQPLAITSGYRSPEHNARVTKSRSQTGAHTYARAVDPLLDRGTYDVPYLLHLAWKHRMTRCGIEMGSDGLRMHLDDMQMEEGFAGRPDGKALFCWTY